MTARFLWLLLRWRLADGRKQLFWDRTPGIPQPERILMTKEDYKKYKARTLP